MAQPTHPHRSAALAEPAAELAGIDPAKLASEPDIWMPHLLAVLDRQLDLYGALDMLGAEQGKLIANGHTDALLTVLSKRQAVVEQLTLLNAQVEPFTAAWPTLVDRLPRAHRDAIAARLDGLGRLVETIRARDDADRRALEEQRNVVAKELNSAGQQRHAVAAYGKSAAASSTPRYQDREG